MTQMNLDKAILYLFSTNPSAKYEIAIHSFENRTLYLVGPLRATAQNNI